ncbi:MAG: PilZ domain-containing protein [Acidobacteriota bacterium]
MRLINRDNIDSSHPFGKRREPRAVAHVPLFLSPLDGSFEKCQVETENVSCSGVRVICNLKLQPGALVEVSSLDERFLATAVICYSFPIDEGWVLGINFLDKTGHWIVS